MSKSPSDDILESLYKLRIRESAQLKTVLELYDMEIHQKISVPNYLKLKTLVKRSIDQKLRLRNFDARHGIFESGAVGICYQWKEKGQCSQGDDAASATKPKIVRKNQNTLPPRLLTKQFHEVEVRRGREVSEAKATPFFDNRADIIWKVPARELLVNIDIRPSANSQKMKRVWRLETSVCFRITRLMNNQIKSRKKEQHPKKKRKRWQECCGHCEKCITIGLHISQGSDSLVSQGRKPQKKPMQIVRFTNSRLRHASVREKKGPSLGKINVRAPHKRSPHAMKFEDRSHEETERQQRCARSKAYKAPFNFRAEDWVRPIASTKRAGGKIGCSWFRSECAYGQ